MTKVGPDFGVLFNAGRKVDIKSKFLPQLIGVPFEPFVSTRSGRAPETADRCQATFYALAIDEIQAMVLRKDAFAHDRVSFLRSISRTQLRLACFWKTRTKHSSVAGTGSCTDVLCFKHHHMVSLFCQDAGSRKPGVARANNQYFHSFWQRCIRTIRPRGSSHQSNNYTAATVAMSVVREACLSSLCVCISSQQWRTR